MDGRSNILSFPKYMYFHYSNVAKLQSLHWENDYVRIILISIFLVCMQM